MAKKKSCAAKISVLPKAKQPFEVPDNWFWTDIASINGYSGTAVDPMKSPETTYELYSVPSSANDFPEIISGSEIGSSKQSVIKNDVLLCKINPRINRVWKVSQHTENELLASSEWIVIRNQILNSDYMMFCFRTQFFREYMLSNVSGVGGSLMRAQPKFVKNYPIPVAPVAEQQRIVDRIESIFAKLDEAKEKAQAVVDGFEVRKAAILYKAFSGELTKQWRKEHNSHRNVLLEEAERASEDWSKKEKNLLEIEQKKSEMVTLENGHEWIHCTIGAFCRITNGSTPSRQSPEYWSGNIPWISSGEVRNNIICTSNECISEEGYNNSSVKLLPAGTVLIAMIGEGKTRGQSAILDIDATINQNIAAIMTDYGYILPRYIWYWLQMNYAKNRERGSGSGPQALNCQRVRELDFFVPNKEEQSEIVSILNSLIKKEQQAKEVAESVLDQIDTMKKAVLARAFCGELGTNDPAEESAVELLKTML